MCSSDNQLSQIYPSHLSKEKDYLQQIVRLKEKEFDRELLCDVLKEQNENFGADRNMPN